jgi:hypothetical integral membrane protein (TIGR02206 family)
MPEFFRYFFGEGETEEFANFTLAHFLPILVAAGIIYLIFRFRKSIREMKHEHIFRYVLAFMLIVSEMSYYWRLVAVPELGPNPVDHLPITVCGWVVVFSSYMLVGKNQTLFDISYFWVFAGTIFALITPTVITYTGPTRYRFYQFWAEHLLGYIAIFYMIFVHGMRPNWRSFRRSFISLAVLAVIAYVANDMIGPGANYLFMSEPTETPSVLDIMPPIFAVRLAAMIIVISALFFVTYLPWYLKDKKAKKAALPQ